MDSLRQHFKDTLLKGMLPVPEDQRAPEVVARINTMAEELAEGVEEFLVAQEFRMTRGKIVVDLEEFNTTKGQTTQVKPQTLLGPYQPLIAFLDKLGALGDAPTPVGPAFKPLQDALKQFNKAVKVATKVSAKDGATTDPFKLSKEEGGLSSKGYAHVGTGEVNDENLGSETIIQLLPEEVKKK